MPSRYTAARRQMWFSPYGIEAQAQTDVYKRQDMSVHHHVYHIIKTEPFNKMVLLNNVIDVMVNGHIRIDVYKRQVQCCPSPRN